MNSRFGRKMVRIIQLIVIIIEIIVVVLEVTEEKLWKCL